MADGDDSQKTEQPSQRKLGQARQRGQVIQSREVNSLFMLGAGAFAALLVAPASVRSAETTLARFLDPAGFLSADGVRWEAVWALLMAIAGAMVLPLLLIVAAALAGSLAQTGLVLATEKVGFDIERLSPLAGFRRLFSLRATLEFLKGVAKAILVASIVAATMWPELAQLPALSSLEPLALSGEIHRLLLRLSLSVLGVVAVLAALDYGWQRWRHEKSLRMTKQELREEMKQHSLPAEVKGALRRRQLQAARARMMAAVPHADVVVVNPTHFAVALKYDGTRPAPECGLT